MSVKLGISSPRFDSPDAFFRWVALCEQSELDSIWQSDRFLSSDASLDPVAFCGVLAGATRRIKFGFNALTLPLRDPVALAKECATIDHLSGGRLLPVFGVGRGQAPDWKATGRDPKERGARANEALEILRRLWSEEHVSFSGKYYQLADATIAPRPVQQPLPLWIGGSSQAAIERTARYGTGWSGGLKTPEQVAPVIRAIQQRARELGRHIDADHYGATLLFRLGEPDDVALAPLAKLAKGLGLEGVDSLVAVGDAQTVVDRARAFRDAGAAKFIAVPLAQGGDDALAQTRRLIDEVVPVVHGFA